MGKQDRMRTHHLKCHPGPFNAIVSGRKQYEIRKDDRGYAVGDLAILHEYHGGQEMFTGGVVSVMIEHKMPTSYGLKDDYCALGIRIEKIWGSHEEWRPVHPDDAARCQLCGRLIGDPCAVNGQRCCVGCWMDTAPRQVVFATDVANMLRNLRRVYADGSDVARQIDELIARADERSS